MCPQTAGDGREYYAANYEDYERQTSAGKLEFYMGLLRAWVPPGSHLFELGVGKGHFLERAATEYACGGCDVNRYGVLEARRRLPQAPIHVGSFECIPSRPAPAAVVAWDVLEHLPAVDDALAGIAARLAASGVLIAVVPVYDGPLGGLVRRLDHDPTHVSRWSRGTWLGKLQEHGFEVADHGGILRRLVFSRWYVHITRPQSVLRRAGTALYFVARKAA